jgi:hypothetical protein
VYPPTGAPDGPEDVLAGFTGVHSFFMERCPGCAYAAPGIGIEPHIDLESIRQVVGSKDYQALAHEAEVHPDARPLLCFGHLRESAGDLIGAGWACLAGAWVCDRLLDADGAALCRKMALERFSNGLSVLPSTPPCPPWPERFFGPAPDLRLVVANIQRRLGPPAEHHVTDRIAAAPMSSAAMRVKSWFSELGGLVVLSPCRWPAFVPLALVLVAALTAGHALWRAGPWPGGADDAAVRGASCRWRLVGMPPRPVCSCGRVVRPVTRGEPPLTGAAAAGTCPWSGKSR